MSFIFGINQDIIEVDKDKNIKFFSQDLVDIILDLDGVLKSLKRITWYLKWLYQVKKAFFINCSSLYLSNNKR